MKTCDADCQGKDKEMLTGLINTRGGFDRLDKKIEMVRRQLMKDFTIAHTFKRLFRTDVCSLERIGEDQM